MTSSIKHEHAEELECIGRILDKNPTINDTAWQDLLRHTKSVKGAKGMTAEQVVRAALIKQMNGYSYEELAFHIIDSTCYRRFCRIGMCDEGFKRSTLCKNIKLLSPETWETINRILVGEAADCKMENGKKTRIDCTVMETNIHEPSDSSLLWDVVRTLTGILFKVLDLYPKSVIPFADHRRRAKKRMVEIQYAKNQKIRDKKYDDLIFITEKTIGYSQRAIDTINSNPRTGYEAMAFASVLKENMELALKVVDQTKRRIQQGEKVPASEKIFSISEPHTDIIIKDRREIHYGHKVCLTSGPSNLIVDCLVLEGNPADSTLVDTMLDRHNEIYGFYPRKIALDGGFASKGNLESAKNLKNIDDVCFSKKRGLDILEMCGSERIYKGLRRFRAGIESAISRLKRCFGFSRCTWKGLRSFCGYVWLSVVSANLLTMAGAILKKQKVQAA